MGKSTISMVMFNSYVTNYQRVSGICPDSPPKALINNKPRAATVTSNGEAREPGKKNVAMRTLKRWLLLFLFYLHKYIYIYTL